MKYFYLILLLLPCFLFSEVSDKTVLISIIARNKAHLLPKYLSCIERLDYDKKQITISIATYNNIDATREILQKWKEENEGIYQKIYLESHDTPSLPIQKLYTSVQMTTEELVLISELKNQAFRKAAECGCDFCFLLDCNVLIAPCALKKLIEQDKPVIAPMLRAVPEFNDVTSTYFCGVSDEGYYEDHPDYLKILFHWKVGTFKVPLVYRAVLIKSLYFDKVQMANETLEHDHILFGKNLREKGIEQFVCNEGQFGVLINPTQIFSLDDERLKLQTLLLIP